MPTPQIAELTIDSGLPGNSRDYRSCGLLSTPKTTSDQSGLNMVLLISLDALYLHFEAPFTGATSSRLWFGQTKGGGRD